MTDVAYLTYAGHYPDVDLPLATLAMERSGLSVRPVRWNDSAVDWSSFGLLLVRSTWDYVAVRDEFVSWAHRVEGITRLRNPASVLGWNTDKSYLRELAGRGVPVVPTAWCAPGEPVDLSTTEASEVVVKPAVSAGAADTLRTGDRVAAAAHAARIAAGGRTAMVQPYLEVIESEGETSILYLGGRPSHAVRRGAVLVPGNTEPHRDVVPIVPTPEQVAVAEWALAAVPEHQELAYARVDLVSGPDGRPVVMELELTEPYLFLGYDEEAPQRLADAVIRCLDA